MRRVRWVLVGLALVGCYAPLAPMQPALPPAVKLETPFDPGAVAWAAGEGENRIEGTALLRTRGGEVRTCAALDVAVIPWSRHAGERMARLYGNLRGGFNPVYPEGRHPRWANDDSAYYETVRSTKCDAAGRFEFEGLPDGEWFVEALVTWEVPRYRYVGGPQGGALMQRVKVEGGQTQKVVLTQ